MSNYELNAHTDYEKKIFKNNIRNHNLGSFERVWVIGAVNGKASHFQKICNQIIEKSELKDRLVFTGNLVGRNNNKINESKKVIDIALQLRSIFMANSSFDLNDIVFLRGCYEELLDKSRELHMSPNPLELVDWMYSRGLDKILESYSISSSLLHHAARDGASALSRASVEINQAIDNNAGHINYMTSLKRLAYNNEKSLLFVSAGLARDKPIEEQSEELWWGGGFANLDETYRDMSRLVRGYDPKGEGVSSGKFSVTLDGGEDQVFAALFKKDGQLLETIQG
jgi:serine/threonine protein phosphatase 1